MDINAKYGYKPYTGPAGPSPYQAELCMETLADALKDLNIEFTTEVMVADEDELYIVVEDRKVIYDRWGFCSYDDVLDQADLNVTVQYLAYKRMSAKRLAQWVEQYPHDEEASDLLDEYRMESAAEREQYGEPEDSPSLEQPWWRNP